MIVKLYITIPVKNNGGATPSDTHAFTDNLQLVVDDWCKTFNDNRPEGDIVFGVPQISRVITDVPEPTQGELKMEFED